MKNMGSLIRRLLTMSARHEKTGLAPGAGIVLAVAAVPAVLSLGPNARSQNPNAGAPPAAHAPNESKPIVAIEDAIQRFIRLAETGAIDSVSARHRWWNSYTSKPVSEQDLMTRPCDCVVVLRGLALRQQVRMLARGLQNYRPRERTTSPFCDFALSAVYRSGDEEILRICVSKAPLFFTVNGETLEAAPQVMYPLTRLFPPDVREEILAHTILQWTSSSQDGPQDGESLEDWLSTLLKH